MAGSRFISALVAPIKRFGAVGPAPFKQTAWERGRADAAAKMGSPTFTLLWVVIPGVCLFIAAWVADNWVIGITLSVLAGIVGFVAVPVGWAVAVALRAAPKQRREARDALQIVTQRFIEASKTAQATKQELIDTRRESEYLKGQLADAEHRHQRELRNVPSAIHSASMIATRDARRQMQGERLRVQLVESMRRAEQDLRTPSTGDQKTPDDLASVLTAWVQEAANILGRGLRGDLGVQLDIGTEDDLTTVEGVRRAYEVRCELLTPLPELEGSV